MQMSERFGLFLVLLFATFLLAGCGGGGLVSTPPPSQPPEATISAAAQALRSGDVTAFAAQINSEDKTEYTQVFNELSGEERQDLGQALSSASLIRQDENEVEFEFTINDGGVSLKFSILLRQNEEGKWEVARL